jgi:chromosome segregation ATPase
LSPLGRSRLTRNRLGKNPKKDAKTLSHAVEELEKPTYQLSTYVPSLEDQVKTLNGTIEDLNTELHARELSLEQTTTAKDDFQHQSTQLTKKLEGTCSSHYHLNLSYVFH